MASKLAIKRRIKELEKILCKSQVIFLVGDDSALEGVEAKEGDIIVLATI